LNFFHQFSSSGYQHVENFIFLSQLGSSLDANGLLPAKNFALILFPQGVYFSTILLFFSQLSYIEQF